MVPVPFSKENSVISQTRPYLPGIASLDDRRSSARRGTLAYPPSPRGRRRRRQASLWRTSTIDTSRRISRVRRLAVPAMSASAGRNNRFSNTNTRENCFYLTLSSLHLFPNPIQFELHSPFRPNQVAAVFIRHFAQLSYRFSLTHKTSV